MEVFADSGVRGATPSIVGGTGTTTKIFPSLLGPNFNVGAFNLGGALGPIGSGGTVPSPNTATPAALLIAPAARILEGQEFEVRAAGTIYIHGTSPTFNFLLQAGTSFTSGSNTTMATMHTAISLTTAAQYPFCFDAMFQGDSISGLLQCVEAAFTVDGTPFELNANARSDTNYVSPTTLTGVKFTGVSPSLSLVFGVTFSVSDALNIANLTQFQAGL